SRSNFPQQVLWLRHRAPPSAYYAHPGGWMTAPSRQLSSISRIASAGVKRVNAAGRSAASGAKCGSARRRMRRLLGIDAEQLLRVMVQDLVGDFLRQAEPLDIGEGLPVDLPILQHRIVAASHDVIGAERFEGA